MEPLGTRLDPREPGGTLLELRLTLGNQIGPPALPEATREHLSSRRTPAHMYLHTPTIMRIHGTYVHGHRMYACVLCDEDVRVHHAHIDEDVHSQDLLQIRRLPQDLSIIIVRACSSAIAIGRTRFSWRFWHQRSAGHLVHSSERSHKTPLDIYIYVYRGPLEKPRPQTGLNKCKRPL